MPTRHQAQKHINWVRNMKNIEIRFHKSHMEVSRLFWVGEVVLPALWLWHGETPAEIVFWINVHTYA